MQLEDGTFLAESNAIIWYLAEGTPLAPRTAWRAPQTLQWMFFEQYSHEPYIAAARFWKHFFDKLTPQQEMRAARAHGEGLCRARRHGAASRASPVLRRRAATASPTSRSMPTRTSRGEGGFNLDNFPHVNAWLARVAAQPGHVTIDHKN